MIKLQDILVEAWNTVYPDDARFGLGAVDAYGAVHFKEFPRDTFGDQMHGRASNPWAIYRFRYLNGEVEWSNVGDIPQDIKNSAENYLIHREYPVTKHTSMYDVIERDDYD